MKFRGKDIPMPAVITGAAGVLWLGSFGVRAIKPDFALGPAVDTLMATCVAWYAKTRFNANGGKDDLLSEVLTKSVLPLVSTAHTDPSPPPAPSQQAPYMPPTAPYVPPRSLPPTNPYTPPQSPPKPGGLPWNS